MFNEFELQGISYQWFLPIIQGFIGTGDTYLVGSPINVVLISRRRRLHAGTRYNARGLDQDGDVANYVETEQIMYFKGQTFSFAQIRASVPLFWQQSGVSAKLEFTHKSEYTSDKFKKHMNEIKDDYGRCLIVNLLAKKKEHEEMLSKEFAEQIRCSGLKHLRYYYFDFHHETRGDNYQSLDTKFIQDNDQLLSYMNYFKQSTTNE